MNGLPASRADFLEIVKATWVAGSLLGVELALHLGESDNVLGALCLKRREPKRDGWSYDDHEKEEWFAVFSARLFLITHGKSSDKSGSAAFVDSAPLSRLRSVRTWSHDTGRGALTLDFAGPVFTFSPASCGAADTINYDMETGWPTADLQAFLAALATARR